MTIRQPHPSDESEVLKLLSAVDFDAPASVAASARLITHDVSLPPGNGHGQAWVAEANATVVGVLHAAPPLRWSAHLDMLTPEERSHVADRLVQVEALSVAPSARGHRLGQRLVDEASTRYRALGYRLIIGNFSTSQPHLVSYYQRQGFTVLKAGEPITFYYNDSSALQCPIRDEGIQMWKPLHPDVHVEYNLTAQGRLPFLMNVFA
ncbi:GNAT family N-acetyltransferase [Streptomyces tauricus]|uniref:GNAT family N-acetyltransferase n=1 Tax=Streptomyces tauricus TaxID=68274 RepID=UPI002244198A|nr:GNAT family N-acetyltransferase [Streptomyces tauricus]MCW8103013.1 GNAT family N-acetyltransferase [Streptomyces tauricus]